MVSRIEFFKQSAKLIGGALAQKVDKCLPEELKNIKRSIYPPGAVDKFADICTACGDCLPVCPENAIVLVEDELSGKELPAIIPSKKACTMCDDLPCISACQEKALLAPPNSKFPKIGIAEIVEELCLAFNGTSCMTCYEACPLKRQAIRMKFNKPVIIDSECTGCGVCENSCVIVGKKGVEINSWRRDSITST